MAGVAGASSAEPQANGIFGPGDIAASGFAGTALQSEALKPGVDPVLKTVIDPDGVTLRIFDGTSLGGPAAGQVAAPAIKLSIKAREIGHVFGLAFDIGAPGSDKSPALYAAATSAFGLHIKGPDADGDGKPDRLLKGAAGAAFIEGQFGGLPGAGPGSIWKIDRATGTVSLFATIGTGSAANSGAGIGGIAIDPQSRTLYASDLDTGLIHRFGIDQQGASLGQFDHGVSGRPLRGRGELKDDGKRLDITSPAFDAGKPETWGMTGLGRRVGGLAVHDGRLFYSVAEGPGIWSVGLGPDGAFNGDVRFEVAVEAAEANPVTGIAFDRDGNMILAQRGEVQNARDYSAFTGAGPAQVLRYRPDQQDRPVNQPRWKPAPEEYAIGSGKENRGSAGGLAMHYSYQPDGSIDLAACSGTLAASADSLGPQAAVHGLQLADANLVRPANVPPDQSTVISFDPRLDDPETRGYAGGVAAFQDCSGAGGSAFPPVAGGDAFPPVTGEGGGGSSPPVADAGDFNFPPVTDDPATDPGGGGGKTTFPPVEGGGGGKTPGKLTVVKSAPAAKCNPKGGCVFNIEVRNDGGEVPGPIVLNEKIEAPQAALTGEPNAPWTCTKAAPFTCTHPGPVPANGKLDLQIVFAVNTTPETKEVKNCATVDGAAAGEGTVPAPLPPAPPAPPAPAPGAPPPPPAPAPVVPPPAAPIPDPNDPKAVPKQIAPDKKSDATPFGLGSLVRLAAFRPQSFSDQRNLIHLAGGAGGNIGGVANNCLERELPPTFNVSQSNGFTVIFTDMVYSVGTVTGKADQVGGTRGRVEGTLVNGKFLTLKVFWNNGTIGDYSVIIDADGKVSGSTSGGGGSAKLSSSFTWPCTRDTICNEYATTARLVAVEFEKNKCGASVGALSTNFSAHVNWCMANKAKQSLDQQHTVRSDALTACIENKKQFCSLIETAAKSKADEFVRRGCENVPFSGGLTDADFRKNVCMQNDEAAQMKVVEVQDAILNDCIAKQAAANGGAGGAPAPAPAPAPVPPAEPLPPQCVVVQIDPNAPVVVEPPPPPPQASKAGTLSLVKTAKPPCRDNRACDFQIVVTNDGNAEFKGQVEFDDNVTGDGAIFGAAALQPPPPAPWACTKGAQGFNCKADLTIAAKASTPAMLLTTDLGAGIGAVKEVKNCATLKGAPTPSCATVPMQAPPPAVNAAKNLMLVQSGDTCRLNAAKARFDCNFAITVSNIGTEPFKGPVTVESTMPGVDGITIGATTEAPWSCPSKGAPAEGVRTCNARDLTLAPNTSTTFPIVVTVPSVNNTLCKIDSTAVIVDPPGGGPLNANKADDTANKASAAFPNAEADPANPGKCRFPVAVGPAPKILAPNLRVKKTLMTGDIGGPPRACTVSGKCPFLITVENAGNSTFEGPIVLHDDVDERTPSLTEALPAAGSGWKCTGIDNNTSLSCSHSVTKLAPGEGVSLLVAVTPGPNWVKNDTLTNCANLALRVGGGGDHLGPGNDPGTVTDDDKACKSVKLDPFAVKVAKTGDSACAPGSDCNFKISLFNPGPIDHVAPVTITDKLTGLSSAQIISITPPLPCAAQPTQIPFSCTTPGDYPLLLGPKGEPSPPKVFDMVVRLPNDVTAEQFSNCASVAGDANAAIEEQACHTVSTKPVAATAPSTGIRPIAKAALSASCNETTPCEFKITVKNTLGRAMTGPIVVNDLVTIGGAPSTQVKLASGPPAPWTCVASAAPGIQCSHPGPLAVNATLDLTLGLQPMPGSIGTASEITNCATFEDIRPGLATACASIPVKQAGSTSPPVKCFGGMVLTDGLCACPGPTKFNGRECAGTGGSYTSKPGDENPANPPPVATPGQSTPASCSAGMVLTGGSCACPTAMKWNGRKCVGTGGINTIDPRPQPQPVPANTNSCPEGFIGSPPKCCPRGTEFRDGACRGPQSPPPKAASCPEGFVGSPPDCCPRGTEFRRGKCRSIEAPEAPPAKPAKVCPANRPVGTYPNCCPSGTEFKRGTCRPVQEQKPQPEQPQQPSPLMKTCPDGSKVFGKYTQCPNDKPKPKRDCGPGYRELDKPNKYGAYCEAIPSQQKCPGGYIGTPPNCQPPPVVYPPCPPGWSGTPGNCKPPAATPTPAPQKCDNGFTGFKPNCTCSGKKEVVNGQCIPKIQ